MKISIIGGGPGGLYFALLVKKEWPAYEVTIYERNKHNDTFGFGVVFSDETLDIFREYDEPSYQAIRRNFAYWDDIDIVVNNRAVKGSAVKGSTVEVQDVEEQDFKSQTFRVAGNGFAGCSRKSLLLLLQARCRELDVQLVFEHEFDPQQLNQEPFANSDLIVAADGINSRIRSTFPDAFGTTIDTRENIFAWMGSTREFEAFTYFFKDTEHGPVVMHCYQYEPHGSTWIIEMDKSTWRGLGFDQLNQGKSAHLPTIEALFAEELAGHRLIDNRSLWIHFPMVRNASWVHENIVLLGDAKATAHFSVGSGTKLAMEDAIGLLEAMRAAKEESGSKQHEISNALQHYVTLRQEEVGKTQHSADVSLQWFEAMQRHWHLPPEQFAFGVMSRSRQITYENLQIRDAAFVEKVQNWFINSVREQGYKVADGTPPMFTPFKLREMEVPNRVVVSPMAQYSAVDGMPTDWHFQHLISRAMGGAGLLFVEMTCPSPDARITPGCTGLWNETQAHAWNRIVDFIHKETATKVCMQLGHAGRKGSTQLGWEQMDYPLSQENWELHSASPIPYMEGISQMPAELSQAQMACIINQFVQSAEYADHAGFDMLELHMAHGYLLASFISPLTNQRTDEYGGPIENRMRFPVALFEAVRQAWPAEKPISVRVSATDWAEGGLREDDLIALTQILRNAGADLIDVSTGQTVSWQKPIYGRMYQTPFADLVRHESDIATMAVGNITTPDQVNTILLQGRADLVAIARHHLSTPYFTNEAAAWYNYRDHFWPKQYWPGRDQVYRLAKQERAEFLRMREAVKPTSHEVK